ASVAFATRLPVTDHAWMPGELATSSIPPEGAPAHAMGWPNYRGFMVLYRGQTVPTSEILSPMSRQSGVASSVELYERLRAQGLSDQEIAGYTARWNDQPVPSFTAPPGMQNQPLGSAGIPTTRLPNIASDFAQ